MLRVLQEGVTATGKRPGGDPRMRLEGFLADFVSTLVNDNGRSDVETRYLAPYIPASAHARSSTRSVEGCDSKSYLGWPTYIDLLMSAVSSSNSLSETRLASCAERKTNLQCE